MEKQIDAEILALENIVALDEVCKLVSDEIAVNILTALDEYIEQKIEACEGYDGTYLFHEECEKDATWFTPENWLVKDDEGNIGFQFFYCSLRERSTANPEDYNSFYVTSLIGSGAQKMCFEVTIDHSYFPGLGRRRCRAFIQNIFQQDNHLTGQGVEYDSADSGVIRIPFFVDLKSLINAYREEDFTEAFAPVGKAIEKSMEVMKMFSAPLEELKTNYPQPED